jgi:RNA polymerase sigma-B factor
VILDKSSPTAALRTGYGWHVQGGHQEARARLIEKHMGLVRSVARRYARGGEPVDDLVQVGAIGLIKAVDRFEPSRGRSLRAVAMPAIEGEIRHHLRDRTHLVRPPQPVLELAARVRRAQIELGAREGRLPTPAEVAAAVGASEDEVAQALQARAPAVPLEPEHAAAAPDDLADERALLQAGMSVLSQRERRILELRYYEDRSQAEIAREVGLSQAQVSRLIRRAVDRMRAAVVDGEGAAYPREEMATREAEERAAQQQQSTHSGRLLVRMPQSLHAELARVAEREGVSLNTLITGALASAVSWREGTIDGFDVVDAEGGAEPPSSHPRWTSIALAANLVVVVLAAIVAIVLLIVALGHGW